MHGSGDSSEKTSYLREREPLRPKEVAEFAGAIYETWVRHPQASGADILNNLSEKLGEETALRIREAVRHSDTDAGSHSLEQLYRENPLMAEAVKNEIIRRRFG